MRSGGTNVIITLNIAFFVLNVIFVALLIFLLKRMTTKKPLVGVDIILVQIVCIFMALFSTILVIPTFEVYLLSAYCNPDPVFNTTAACYQGIHLGNTILGSMNLLVQIVLIAAYTYYYKEYNPMAYSPFASAGTLIKLVSILRL